MLFAESHLAGSVQIPSGLVWLFLVLVPSFPVTLTSRVDDNACYPKKLKEQPFLSCLQEGEDIVLVQECAEKGDLFQLLKQRAAVLSESQAQTVLLPLMNALQYLHSM